MFNYIFKVCLIVMPVIYPIAVLSPLKFIDKPVNRFILDYIVPCSMLLMILGSVIVYLVKRNRKSIEFALLLPLWTTPVYIAGHWAAVPGHLGIGSGGLEFFIHWLTKYPNFGPVNYEVALGTICVMGAHIVPYVFCVLYHPMENNLKKRYVFFALFLLTIIFYVPVLIRLDYYSISLVLAGYFPVGFYSGPLFRLLAVISMAMILVYRVKCERMVKEKHGG